MSKSDAALRQVFQLGQEVMAGNSAVTARDIERFRRRPQGPYGHPMLVRSERLATDRCDDLQVTADNRPCLLKRLHNDDICGLVAKTGQSSWILKYDEPATCEQGRIIGFNTYGEPIIEMIYAPTSEAGCVCSRIYIGERPVLHTSSQLTQKNSLFWTMGADGRLYGLRRRAKNAAWYELVGYNTTTCVEEVCVPSGPHEDEGVCALAVVSEKLYAFATSKSSEAPNTSVTIHGERWPRGLIKKPKNFVAIARTEQNIWLVDQDPFGFVSLSDAISQPNGLRSSSNPARGYLRGLGFATGYTTFITERPHGQEGWVADGKSQPGFERVSDLFMDVNRWRYWAIADEHLFLMELPVDPQKA